MLTINGPVDLFNGTTFVRAFKNLDKAVKFVARNGRVVKTPMYWAHDEKNGEIPSAGRAAGSKNQTTMVMGVRTSIIQITSNGSVQASALGDMGSTPLNWEDVPDVLSFVDNFEDEEIIFRPSYQRNDMVEMMERLY